MSYPNPTNITSLYQMFIYANNNTQQIFGVGILLSLYLIVVVYLNSRGNDIEDCFIVAGYISSIVAVFLYVWGNMISQKVMFMMFALLILSALWSYINKD